MSSGEQRLIRTKGVKEVGGYSSLLGIGVDLWLRPQQEGNDQEKMWEDSELLN